MVGEDLAEDCRVGIAVRDDCAKGIGDTVKLEECAVDGPPTGAAGEHQGPVDVEQENFHRFAESKR